jgi:hypothetical protein
LVKVTNSTALPIPPDRHFNDGLVTRLISLILASTEIGSFRHCLPPELRAEILSHLYPYDLRRYALACKAFNADAERLLWTGFSIDWKNRGDIEYMLYALQRFPQRANRIKNLRIIPAHSSYLGKASSVFPAAPDKLFWQRLKDALSLLIGVKSVYLDLEDFEVSTPDASRELVSILVDVFAAIAPSIIILRTRSENILRLTANLTSATYLKLLRLRGRQSEVEIPAWHMPVLEYLDIANSSVAFEEAPNRALKSVRIGYDDYFIGDIGRIVNKFASGGTLVELHANMWIKHTPPNFLEHLESFSLHVLRLHIEGTSWEFDGSANYQSLLKIFEHDVLSRFSALELLQITVIEPSWVEPVAELSKMVKAVRTSFAYLLNASTCPALRKVQLQRGRHLFEVDMSFNGFLEEGWWKVKVYRGPWPPPDLIPWGENPNGRWAEYPESWDNICTGSCSHCKYMI